MNSPSHSASMHVCNAHATIANGGIPDLDLNGYISDQPPARSTFFHEFFLVPQI